MSVTVQKDRMGSVWVISRKKDGFTRQLYVDYQEMQVLHKRLGDILKQKI